MESVNVLDRISCHNFVYADRYIYFSNWFYNGLFEVEIETGKTFFYGNFENEKFSEINVHKEIFIRDEKVYFCPWRGGHMHILKRADRTISSIEIRSKEEPFSLIETVTVGEDSMFFRFKEEEKSAKKFDFQSLKVTHVNHPSEIQGTPLADEKERFPDLPLLEGNHIEYADRFFWKQISNGVWYGFMPMGRHLLRYIEESGRIEKNPLIVVNEIELQEYLHVVRKELLKQPVYEMPIKLQEFLECLKLREAYISDGSGKKNLGNKIWNTMLGMGKV